MKSFITNKTPSNRWSINAQPSVHQYDSVAAFASSSTHDTIALYVGIENKLGFYRCGQTLSTVTPGYSATTKLAISGDGSTCAYCNGEFNGTVKIYATATGTLIQTLTGTGYFGESMALSYDGTRIIIGARARNEGPYNYIGQAYLYNTTTGTLLNTFSSPVRKNDAAYGRQVAISYDGATVVISAQHSQDSGGYLRGAIYVQNASDGAVISTLAGTQDYQNYGANPIQMTWDGSRYCTYLADRTYAVNAQTGAIEFQVASESSTYIMSADGSTFVRFVDNSGMKIVNSRGTNSNILPMGGLASYYGVSHDGGSLYSFQHSDDGMGYYYEIIRWA